MKRRPGINPAAFRELAVVVGYATGLAGIGSYDWRLALVLGGFSMMAGGLYGMARSRN